MDKIKKMVKICQKVFMTIFQIKVVVKNLNNKKMTVNITSQDQTELKL